jgi:putative oxygen-independent coproporphyrinogen III oxidase
VLSLPPLSLYIHIPWCAKKCPYCDFNSHVDATGIPEAAYIDCLLRDLESELPYVQGRQLQSIFIGGGTPSLFSASGIARILEACANKLPFADNIEITMEANPGSSEQQKFADLYHAGINRLSIGIQSFQQEHLTRLGRVHNSHEALDAVIATQKVGFKRINLDLMHGLPGQTVEQALADVQQAINTGVEHISWYQLTIEQNTEFFRYPPVLPVEDELADIQEAGFSLLHNNGFRQYEISAFSKNQQQARHNLNYWQFGDYLAIGAGAHGKITVLDQQHIIRYQKTRLPKDYMARTTEFGLPAEKIATDDVLFEGLMNCLRLNEGMDTESLLRYTGASHEKLQNLCQPLVNDGLLLIGNTIHATPLGRRYLNTVLERLLNRDMIA